VQGMVGLRERKGSTEQGRVGSRQLRAESKGGQGSKQPRERDER
jgi:hypothetical protein